MPTRLTGMNYDEVSLVDAGASDDGDSHGAHVLLMKRDDNFDGAIIDLSKRAIGDGPSTPAPKKSAKKDKKTGSQREKNWKDERHPHQPAGSSAGGEWAKTSSDSKKKYGKGGTTGADIHPEKYKTSNKAASNLEHGITQSQKKMLDEADAKKGAASKKKSDAAAAKKQRDAQRAQNKINAAAKKKAATQVAAINSLADNQRNSYKSQGKPIPAGYSWDGNRLVPVEVRRERQRARQGLPGAATKPKKSSGTKGSKGAATTNTLVMGTDGKFTWKKVSKRVMEKGATSVTVREKALLSKWLNVTEGAN